ncbi:dethiobiotin synthase [Halorussus sp. MSC15.2]|uniref:dethiobiotin synthase n=1 Tax=Halorussus sp. MSC15.2 TaxID=2283638 RepID=UPI0013D20F6D|nr:dethiobiotin synthase [Halorussus sp. MSC15.2]NEU57703.1 dethiobiotin synthase [Halorussus sp. MSC15.2]
MTARPNLAVVGTDTGVGKTVVTAAVVARLRDRGLDARAVKPAQTGYPPDDDAGFVAEACGSDEAATCLRRLEPPLAPAVAAEQSGESLDYAELRDGCRRAMARSEVAVVEGIGGLRVPLADGREVADLVADLDVPALVVARSGLGTLNHTALTVTALRRRGVAVSGVVLNEFEGATTAERTNPAVVAEMTDANVGTVPPVAFDRPTTAVSAVESELPGSVLPDELA